MVWTATGEELSFVGGIKEIELATEIARRRYGRLLRQILRLYKSLSWHPKFDGLRRPFEDGFRHRFVPHYGGMLVSIRVWLALTTASQEAAESW